MKFTCQKEKLLKMITATDVITGNKATHSVLSNILLEVADTGMLEVQANNMSMSMSGKMEVKMEKAGAITVSQVKLSSLLREMPEGEVLLECNEENKRPSPTDQSNSSSKSFYPRIPKDEFTPPPPLSDEVPKIAMEKLHFKK